MNFAPLAFALLLGGCSSNNGGDWSLVYTMAKNYWDGPAGVSLEQASSVPYASIGVSIGGGPQAMFVLATGDREDLMWMAGHNVAITTRDGRIIRTAGLEHDLSGFASNSSLPFIQMLRSARGSGDARDEWTADFPDLRRFSVPVSCALSATGEEVITILGTDIRTTRIDEKCDAAEIGWSFTNNYWVDRETGVVWRSYQHVHPALAGIELDLLRPPERS